MSHEIFFVFTGPNDDHEVNCDCPACEFECLAQALLEEYLKQQGVVIQDPELN